MNLSEKLTKILETSSLCDANEIADKLLSDIPPRERRVALAEVLPSWVRWELQKRHGVRVEFASESATLLSSPSPSSSAPRSSRWEAYSVYSERWSNGSETKLLGDFTVEDIDSACAFRERHIEGVRRTLDKLQILRQAVIDARVKTVGELLESRVAEIMR